MNRYTRITAALLIAATLVFAGQTGSSGSTLQPAAGQRGWGALELLGRTIAPGETRKFKFMHSARFESAYIDIPVFVTRGTVPGPMLCVTAAIHGDEINGVEIARRVFNAVAADQVKGTLVVLPIVNRHGFLMRQRYMADRMDLNRYFPGRPDGNVTSMVAHAVFDGVVKHCDALIDLHTAAFFRNNLPQVRVDLKDQKALAMARHFGAGIILGKPGYRHTLRSQAIQAGIPAILYEGGESNRFQMEEIKIGVAGVLNVMAYLEMLDRAPRRMGAQQVYTTSTWVRVPPGRGGNFFPERKLGARVLKGDLLGSVIDPMTSETFAIRAPFDARIIGASIPQVTLSGFILFDLVRIDDQAPAE